MWAFVSSGSATKNAGFKTEAGFSHLFNSQCLTYFICITRGYDTGLGLFKATNNRSFSLTSRKDIEQTMQVKQ